MDQVQLGQAQYSPPLPASPPHFLRYLASPTLSGGPATSWYYSHPTAGGTNVRGLWVHRIFLGSDSPAAVTRQRRLASSVTAPILATLCVALPGAVTSSLANSPRWGPEFLDNRRGKQRSCSLGTRDRQAERDRALSFCDSVQSWLKTPSHTKIPPPAVAVVRPRSRHFGCSVPAATAATAPELLVSFEVSGR